MTERIDPGALVADAVAAGYFDAAPETAHAP